MIRAVIARFSGDLEHCVAMASRALELLPETESTARERAGARINASLAYEVSGDVTPAKERPLEEAIAAFRASGALIPQLISITSLAHAVHNAAWEVLGAFTATSYSVIVNKYLVGDFGILILVGAVIGAVWLNRRLMRSGPDETRPSVAGGQAPAV